MKKSFGKYAFIMLFLLAGLYTDRYAKKWAIHHLKGKPAVSAIKNFLELGCIENRGMVFGILNKSDHPHPFISIISWVRVVVSIAVTIFIFIKRRMSFFFLLPLLFIWMGAVGNLINSFTLGYVIDFIHIHVGNILDWPFFFNIADAYICIGAGLLVLSGLFNPEKRTLAAPKN
jgi:signal peptidase II